MLSEFIILHFAELIVCSWGHVSEPVSARDSTPDLYFDTLGIKTFRFQYVYHLLITTAILIIAVCKKLVKTQINTISALKLVRSISQEIFAQMS